MKFNIVYILLLFIQTNTFCQESIDDEQVYFLKKHYKKMCLANADDKRLTKDFDTITSDRKYIFCYLNKKVSLYTKDTLQLVANNARAIYAVAHTNDVYQMLVHNKLVWLKADGKKLNEDPNEYSVVAVCGTVTSSRSSIQKYNDSTFYSLTVYDVGGALLKAIRKNITALVGAHTLTFLNGSSILNFDGNSLFSKGLNDMTFIEKNQQGVYSIIMFDTLHNRFEKRILLENCNKFYYNGFKPFIYQQKNLFGYYPLTPKAKYKMLMPFNGNFARFLLANGKYGWLDITGIEYIDE